MSRRLNAATAIGFVMMTLIAIHMASKISGRPPGAEPEKILQSSIHNDTYLEDSLCRIWVDDTATRIAFKTWYKKQKTKTK